MPITSSAKKALRVSKRRRVFNVRKRDEITKVTKNLKKLVADKKKSEAEKYLTTVFKTVDKAAKTGFIKKNTAGRKKSRLSAMVSKM